MRKNANNDFNAESWTTDTKGVKDVSDLAGDTGTALVGGSSMSAGNSINHPNTTVGPAPGSQPVNLPQSGPDYHTDAPAVEVGSSVNHTHKERG